MNDIRPDGLFFSSLDHYKQVKSEESGICSCKRPNCPHTHYQNEDGTHGPWETPLPTRTETAFRHSGWLPARGRVARALEAADVPIKRRQRFACCGASAFVEINTETGEARCKGFYCGDRFCKPCGAARAARARRAIAALLGTSPGVFFTLTLRAKETTVTEALNRLVRHFKKLRTMPRWKRHVDGGAFVIEIKRGSGSGEWHVHLHGLYHGRIYDRAALSADWFEATGDSFIVDVDEVRSPERAAGYVCKYLTKGFDSSVLRSPNDLRDCILATSGRRLLVTFGDWFGRVDVDRPPATAGWRVVGGLDGILARADAGDEWARGVIFCLRLAKGLGAQHEGEPVVKDADRSPDSG